MSVVNRLQVVGPAVSMQIVLLSERKKVQDCARPRLNKESDALKRCPPFRPVVLS